MPHGDFRKLSSISIKARKKFRWKWGKEFRVSEMITVRNWSHQNHIQWMRKSLGIHLSKRINYKLLGGRKTAQNSLSNNARGIKVSDSLILFWMMLSRVTSSDCLCYSRIIAVDVFVISSALCVPLCGWMLHIFGECVIWRLFSWLHVTFWHEVKQIIYYKHFQLTAAVQLN